MSLTLRRKESRVRKTFFLRQSLLNENVDLTSKLKELYTNSIVGTTSPLVGFKR